MSLDCDPLKTMNNNGDADKSLSQEQIPAQPEVPPLWKSLRLKIVLFSSMVLCSSFASQASMTSAMVCMDSEHTPGNSTHPVLNHTLYNTSFNSTHPVLNHTLYNISFNSTHPVINHTLHNTSFNSTHPVPQASSPSSYDVWELSWGAETQGLVVSAFFVGYCVVQMPSGVIVTKVGPTKTLGVALVCAGLMHLLTIPAARWSMPLLYVARTTAGLACGCVIPGVYALLANWCPAQESSFLLGVAGGGIELGNTLSFTLALVGCESGVQGGWPIVFYAMGGFMIVMAMIMMLVITDFPCTNKHIDMGETHYIRSNRVHEHRASYIPFRRIMTSPQVWAFLVAQFAIEWTHYTFVTQGPLYLRDVIKLPPWQTNLLGALPFLAVIPVYLVVNYWCDKVIQRNMASRTNVRKFNQLYATVFTAIPILVFGFLPEGDWGLAFVIYTSVALGITGTYAGFMANPGDLSPAHAGFLASLGQALTLWVAFVIPTLTGYVTRHRDRPSWQVIFYAVVGVEAAAIVFYLIFGSGDLEPWAVEVTEETPIVRRDSSSVQGQGSN